MIKKETVLILGAGASSEFGFPLGRKLIEQIYQLVEGKTAGVWEDFNDGIGSFLHKSKNFKPAEIKNSALLASMLYGFLGGTGGPVSFQRHIMHFSRTLAKSNPSSIDEFLWDRTDPYFALIGKLCILLVLSQCESKDIFFPHRHQDHFIFPSCGWYKYLWGSMRDGIGRDFNRLKENKLKVLTFNYDRSLEHFLFTSMVSLYNRTRKEVADVFEAITVEHINGELGVLPWKYRYSSKYRNVERLWIEEASLNWSDVSERLISNGWAVPVNENKVHLMANLAKTKDAMSEVFNKDFLKILPILQRCQSQYRGTIDEVNQFSRIDPGLLLRIYGGAYKCGIHKDDWENGKIIETAEEKIRIMRRLVGIANAIKTAEQEIKVCGDESCYESILRNADRIYFLGFGYHMESLSVLGFKENMRLKKGVELYGTAVGKTDKQVESIKNYFVSTCGFSHVEIANKLSDQNDDKSVITDFFCSVAPLE